MEQTDLFEKREVALAEDGTTVGHGNPRDEDRARLAEQSDQDRESDPDFQSVGAEAEGDEITEEDRLIAQELRERNTELEDTQDEDVNIARRLQNGSEEEAARYLAQLRQQGPTERDVNRIVEERFKAHAMQRFADQNRDILGNPYLDGAAAAAFQRLRGAGDTRSDLDVMQSAVTEVRTWVRGMQRPAIEPEKVQRKASITTLPQASGRMTLSRDDEEENPSDVIQQMARSRGQGFAR